MQTLTLKKRQIDHTEYVKRSALEADYDVLIDEDVIAIDADTQEIIFVHKKLDFPDHAVMTALGKIEYQENTRTSGLKTRSRIFGYSPRNIVRKDYCSATSLSYKQPAEHAAIIKYGQLIAQVYQELTPGGYAKHKAIMEAKVLDEYAIRNTPFTSGIINKNNPLKYHFDSGNVKDVYSCMAVFKRDIRGGVSVFAGVRCWSESASQQRLYVRRPKRLARRNPYHQDDGARRPVLDCLLLASADLELLTVG